MSTLQLAPDRYFEGDAARKAIARALYEQVRALPLICPHGHVDPRLFAEPDYLFGSPVDLFIIPDHYVTRMLVSQGVGLDELGVSARDGSSVERNHRMIWQLFAEKFGLFRGTPTGAWLNHEFFELFEIREKLTADSAQRIYDQIVEKLATPAFKPRALYQHFNIEVLATTDAATDELTQHAAIHASVWTGRIIPTFRPDAVVNIDGDGWSDNIQALGRVSGVSVHDYHSFIAALEQRRAFFKQMGARATDHAALSPYTVQLSDAEAGAIFQRALAGTASLSDAQMFTGHMLIQMARMSCEDGLVMQLHTGSLRNHNPSVYARFGRDMGADIPIAAEYTRNLKPLLDAVGSDARMRLILFTLDESTYARELAPLAGHYPALRLGPPWWFHDSFNGITRFFDGVMETAGVYNTAGFNDDTRAFCSIAARHDVWRRASANWLAGQVSRGIIDRDDAHELCQALCYGLAKDAYRL